MIATTILGTALQNYEQDPTVDPDLSMCYTRCEVVAGACATIVDQFSVINAASECLVNVLGLSRMHHTRPHISWINNRGLYVHKVKVKFSLCGHGDVMIRDVIPLDLNQCLLISAWKAWDYGSCMAS